MKNKHTTASPFAIRFSVELSKQTKAVQSLWEEDSAPCCGENELVSASWIISKQKKREIHSSALICFSPRRGVPVSEWPGDSDPPPAFNKRPELKRACGFALEMFQAFALCCKPTTGAGLGFGFWVKGLRPKLLILA